jgi:hypothetical protein
VAFDSAEELPRRNSSGFWGVDHLETGIFCESKHVPVTHRIRHDDTFSKIRDNPHLVRAWLIVFLFLASSGAAIFQILWGYS